MPAASATSTIKQSIYIRPRRRAGRLGAANCSRTSLPGTPQWYQQIAQHI